MTTHNSLGKKRSPLYYLCLLLLLLLAPGCGGCRGVLTGKVSFQGEPVQAGSVLLVGADSRPMTAAIKEDGSYTFTNVPPGEVKLAVYASTRNARLAAALQKAFGGGIVLDGNGGIKGLKIVMGPGDDLKKEAVIPASYKDLELSGLRTTIHSGSNTYDIEMK